MRLSPPSDDGSDALPQCVQGCAGLVGVEGAGAEGVQDGPFGGARITAQPRQAGRQRAFHRLVAGKGEPAEASRVGVSPGPGIQQEMPQVTEGMGAIQDIVVSKRSSQDVTKGASDGLDEPSVCHDATIGEPRGGLGQIHLDGTEPIVGSTEVPGANFLRVDGEVAEVVTGGVSAGVKQATDPTFLHVSGEGADLDCRKQDLGSLGRQQFVSDGAEGVCVWPG